MRRWTVTVWVLAVTLWAAGAAPSADAAPSAPCTDEYVGPDGGAWDQASVRLAYLLVGGAGADAERLVRIGWM